MMVSGMICLVLVVSGGSFAQQGVPSVVRFRVVDNSGAPATNATLDGCFLDFSESGGRDRFNASTDANGVFVARGTAVLGISARVACPGHYPTTVKRTIEYKRKADGKGYERLDSWNTEIPVVLKKISRPIAMCAKRVESFTIRNRTRQGSGRFVTNSVAGYDLVQGDLVAPYGRGDVSDLDLMWRLDVLSRDADLLPVDSDTLFELRMTNGLDGICRGSPDGSKDRQSGSAYLSAYEAPTEGYTNSISLSRRVRGTQAEENDDHHYLYYFRIRTQTNQMGQVTNALYGKIYGRINASFSYYLNPTPNDRNLEFDPKRNLFKDLKAMEQVREP